MANREVSRTDNTRPRLPQRRRHGREDVDAVAREYLDDIDQVSRWVVTPGGIERGLLAAKMAAAARKAKESHESGGSFPIHSETGHTARESVRKWRHRDRVFLIGMTLQSAVFGAFIAFAPTSETSGMDQAIAVGNTALTSATAVLMLIRRRTDHRCSPLANAEAPPWAEQLNVIASRARPVRFPLRRRIVDVGFAVVWLLLLAPVLVALSLVLASKGRQVLRRQPRVGQGGKAFTLVQFRTGDLPSSRLRRFVRKYGVDQLPRLWNLLKGDLTLLGPKPEYPKAAVRYPVEHQWVFAYRPGLAGPVAEGMTKRPSPKNPVELDEYLTQVVPVQARINRMYLGDPGPKRFCVLLWRAMYSLVVHRATAGVLVLPEKTAQPSRTSPHEAEDVPAPLSSESTRNAIACWAKHEVVAV